MAIHPTAIIDPKAKIDSSAEIGAYAIIGGNVEIAAGCKIAPHASIDHCRLGERTRVGTHTVLGGDPQMLNWKEVPSLVVIGKDVWIHELVTIHRGMYENGVTSIGDRCMIMSNSHIAHDCDFHNDVIYTTLSGVAGHVTIEEFAIISAEVGIHQHVRIGAYAMVGGMSRIVQDVVPFMMVEGSPAKIRTTNAIGLKRKGFSKEARDNIRRAFKVLFQSGLSTSSAVEELKKLDDSNGVIKRIIDFIGNSKRGLTGG